jgi:protein-disulfide isomerase
MLARFHSPSLGDANARVHIVEFLDPACETCRRFHPLVKRLMESHPGRIRLSVRYAPFHKGSEDIVRLLEAAKRQGRFWQTLEALFAAQPRWVVDHVARLDLAWSAVQGLGLELDRVKQDMKAPELTQVIRQDIEDAVKLNVTKTPEFFVNGRPMPRFGYEELETLVREALREAYR